GFSDKYNNMVNTVSALGGMKDDEAKTVVAQALFGNDGAYALPKLTVALLHRTGGVEPLLDEIEAIGDEGKELVKKYSAVGMRSSTFQMGDSSQLQQEASDARDAILVDLLSRSPELLSSAMKKAGLPSSTVNTIGG